MAVRLFWRERGAVTPWPLLALVALLVIGTGACGQSGAEVSPKPAAGPGADGAALVDGSAADAESDVAAGPDFFAELNVESDADAAPADGLLSTDTAVPLDSAEVLDTALEPDAPTVDAADALDSTAQDMTAPDTTGQDSSPPDTTAPDTTAPDTTAPDTATADSPPPDNGTPDAADTSSTDAGPTDTVSIDTTAPDATPPDANDISAPDTSSPDTFATKACKSANACDDGDPCTTDACSAGYCAWSAVAGCLPALAPCDAANPCKQGVCDPSMSACVACLSSSDCGSGFLCQGKVCKPSPKCKSDIECKATGQVCSKTDGACVDCQTSGDCGSGKACVDHACVPSQTCKSSKECTGLCDPKAGVCVACLSADDCATGQFCGPLQECIPAVCQGAVCGTAGGAFACKPDGSGYTVQSCDDSNPCTTGSCQQGQGCVQLAAAATCSDGSACTLGDACSGGLCQAGTGKPACDDANPCTTDTCDPKLGCTHGNSADGGPCNDGDACTFQDNCKAGSCSGAKGNCEDGNPCTTDGCDPKAGCTFLKGTGPCDDGNACTAGESCADGKCAGGQAVACNDNNPCTSDECKAGQGCVSTPANGSCDDGDACTTGDACVNGTCAATAKSCDDGNSCTTDTCQAGNCKAAPAADGAPCGGGKVCQSGNCQALGGDPCTSGSELFSKKMNGGKVLYAVRPLPSGGWMVGGGTYGWLARIDASGGPVWQKYLSKSETDSIRALSPLPGGHWAVLMQTYDTMLSSSAQWRKVDADGNSLASESFDGGNLAAMPDTMVAVADGYIVAGTAKVGPSQEAGWLQKLSPEGKPLWSKTFVQGGNSNLYHVAARPGGYAAVGRTYTGNQTTGWLLLTDDKGAQLASLPWGKPVTSAYEHLEWVHALPDGALLVVGSRNTDQGLAGVVARTDAAGKVLWQSDLQVNSKTTAFEVAGMHPDGTLWAASTANIPFTLVRVSPATGKLLWYKSLPSSGAMRLFDIAMHADGSVAMAGYDSSSPQGGMLVHVDAWGYTSCTASGTCAKIASCEDGNDCTQDTCSPQSGCASTPSSGSCQDGDACTSGDTCQSGSCQPVKVVTCNDNSICTADSCNPKTGCTYLPKDGTCDDANPCTYQDACKSGACAGVLANCDDGDVCTADSCGPLACVHEALSDEQFCGDGKICKAGKCTVGMPSDPCLNKELFVASYGESTTSSLAMVALPGGGFVVGGSQGLLARFGPGGAPLWQKKLPIETVSDAILNASGQLALVGTNNKIPVGTSTRLLLADLQGSVVKDIDLSSGSGSDAPSEVLAMSDGGLLLVGVNDTAGKAKSRAIRVDKDGKVLWAKTSTAISEDIYLGVAPRGQNGALLVGWAMGAGETQAAVTAIDESGAVQWTKTFPSGNKSNLFHGAAATADGGSLVAGTSNINGQQYARLVRLTANGLIIWDRNYYESLDYTSAFYAVRSLPNGDAAVSGYWLASTVLARYDGDGNLKWHRSYANTGSSTGMDMELLHNGFAVLSRQPGKSQPIRLLRTDIWGNLSCSEAGSCSAEPATSCQDTNPCSTDFCQGGICKHGQVPNGLGCGDGKFCKAGVCQ